MSIDAVTEITLECSGENACYWLEETLRAIKGEKKDDGSKPWAELEPWFCLGLEDVTDMYEGNGPVTRSVKEDKKGNKTYVLTLNGEARGTSVLDWFRIKDDDLAKAHDKKKKEIKDINKKGFFLRVILSHPFNKWRITCDNDEDQGIDTHKIVLTSKAIDPKDYGNPTAISDMLKLNVDGKEVESGYCKSFDDGEIYYCGERMDS